MKYISYTSTTPASLLQKAGVIVATTVLGGLALMFSAVFLVVILSMVAVAWTVLMWKTRTLRKQMRDVPPCDASLAHEEFAGEVIEGEVIHVDESRDKIRG
jgi:hypothetical protein